MITHFAPHQHQSVNSGRLSHWERLAASTRLSHPVTHPPSATSPDSFLAFPTLILFSFYLVLLFLIPAPSYQFTPSSIRLSLIPSHLSSSLTTIVSPCLIYFYLPHRLPLHTYLLHLLVPRMNLFSAELLKQRLTPSGSKGDCGSFGSINLCPLGWRTFKAYVCAGISFLCFFLLRILELLYILVHCRVSQWKRQIWLSPDELAIICVLSLKRKHLCVFMLTYESKH